MDKEIVTMKDLKQLPADLENIVLDYLLPMDRESHMEKFMKVIKLLQDPGFRCIVIPRVEQDLLAFAVRSKILQKTYINTKWGRLRMLIGLDGKLYHTWVTKHFHFPINENKPSSESTEYTYPRQYNHDYSFYYFSPSNKYTRYLYYED